MLTRLGPLKRMRAARLCLWSLLDACGAESLANNWWSRDARQSIAAGAATAAFPRTKGTDLTQP